jgi:hypothetical protein
MHTLRPVRFVPVTSVHTGATRDSHETHAPNRAQSRDTPLSAVVGDHGGSVSLPQEGIVDGVGNAYTQCEREGAQALRCPGSGTAQGAHRRDADARDERRVLHRPNEARRHQLRRNLFATRCAPRRARQSPALAEKADRGTARAVPRSRCIPVGAALGRGFRGLLLHVRHVRCASRLLGLRQERDAQEVIERPRDVEVE